MKKAKEQQICDMVASDVQKLILKVAMGEETADRETLLRLQAIVEQAQEASKRSKRRWW